MSAQEIGTIVSLIILIVLPNLALARWAYKANTAEAHE